MTQNSKNKLFKCGFVSIVGRPNVGKSTLVNSILRNNISIVTRKPQTTRNRILGIYTMPEYQAIFIDTPGIHINEKKAINRVMNKTAINAIMDTNLNLFVCDSWAIIEKFLILFTRIYLKSSLAVICKF